MKVNKNETKVSETRKKAEAKILTPSSSSSQVEGGDENIDNIEPASGRGGIRKGRKRVTASPIRPALKRKAALIAGSLSACATEEVALEDSVRCEKNKALAQLAVVAVEWIEQFSTLKEVGSEEEYGDV